MVSMEVRLDLNIHLVDNISLSLPDFANDLALRAALTVGKDVWSLIEEKCPDCLSFLGVLDFSFNSDTKKVCVEIVECRKEDDDGKNMLEFIDSENWISSCLRGNLEIGPLNSIPELSRVIISGGNEPLIRDKMYSSRGRIMLEVSTDAHHVVGISKSSSGLKTHEPIGKITSETRILIRSKFIKDDVWKRAKLWIDFENDANLRKLVQIIRGSLGCDLRYPNSVLIHGMPGSGKSSLVWMAIQYLNQNENLIIRTVELTLVDWILENEVSMRKVRLCIEDFNPIIIVFKDLDIIFSSDKFEILNSGLSLEQHAKLRLEFCQLLSDFPRDEYPHLFIGISTQPKSLHEDILHSFGTYISLGGLSLREVRGRFRFAELDSRFEDFINSCSGLTHADISSLQKKISKNSSMEEFQRHLDFLKSRVGNSVARETIPKTRWKDVAGLNEVKSKLMEMIIYPLKFADRYRKLRIKPAKGILLYGLPGTGKTLIARALASESNARFFNISIPQIIRSEVGESEKFVSELFQRAKDVAPSVIFLDEFQAMFTSRDSADSSGGGASRQLTSQLMIEMDHLQGGKSEESCQSSQVIVIAATNVIDAIDPALLRPGRFDHVVHVPVPDTEARRSLLLNLRAKMKWSEDVDIEKLVSITQDFTGAEIQNIAHSAGLARLLNDINANSICMEDFLQVLASSGRPNL